jgi:hypothetical protein
MPSEHARDFVDPFGSSQQPGLRDRDISIGLFLDV